MDEFGSDVVNLHDTQVDQMDVTNVRLRSTQEDTGMLKPEVVDRIHELSDEGLGSKRIARQLKVSRRLSAVISLEPQSVFKNAPLHVASTPRR